MNRGSVLIAGNPTHGRGLDATVVFAAEDLECSVQSPVAVPRVGDEPVGRALLLPEANDANGVTTQLTPLHVLVHAFLVVEQVLVDSEGRLNGAVGGDLVAHCHLILLHGVCALAPSEVSAVVAVIATLAFPLTLRSAALSSAVGSLSSDVVFARLDGIRTTTLLRPVSPSTDESVAHPISPRMSGETTVTAFSAHEPTAREEVFGREAEVLPSLGVDAPAVTHGLHGTERPARSTRALVPDLSDGGTVWPRLTRIEGGGNGAVDPGSLERQKVEGVVRVHTHEGEDPSPRVQGVEVVASLPGGVHGVDGFDEVIAQRMRVRWTDLEVNSKHSRQEEKEQSLHCCFVFLKKFVERI